MIRAALASLVLMSLAPLTAAQTKTSGPADGGAKPQSGTSSSGTLPSPIHEDERGQHRDAGVPQYPDDGQIHCDLTLMSGVAAWKKEIVDCILAHERAVPNSSGVLKMHWTIRPDGSVGDAKAVRPTKDEADFARCMTGLVRHMKFDARPKTDLPVDFPFKYSDWPHQK